VTWVELSGNQTVEQPRVEASGWFDLLPYETKLSDVPPCRCDAAKGVIYQCL
jgi:hypothetical protein